MRIRKSAFTKVGILSGAKVSILAILLAFGFTACQSETIEPKSGSANKSKSVDKTDKGIVAEKPPREPDGGGGN